jgi:hypothetical protein
VGQWTNPLSAFQQHLVRFAKIATLVSVAWTVLCAILLVGWQTTLWLQEGVWNSYSLSSLIGRLERDRVATYVTAGAAKLETGSINKQAVLNWLLEMPSIVPLLIASALLLGFYIWLKDIEKKSAH